ncbi:hypothetical protein DYQ86_14935 [Acidobacteria bacterium AB60]|nr:hypothetical protein DYQ86_14935 [Acidobacteria bacterium AB60]
MEKMPILTGQLLPHAAANVLQEILRSAGLTTARVSDVGRTFDEQAKVLVDYYKLHGAAAAKALYGHGPGGKAIAIFEEEMKSKPMPEVLRHMSDAMRDAITKEIGHGGQKHLMHTSSTHFVFDVAPSSILNHAAFVKAASQHPKVTRFLHPHSLPPDKVFHLEVKKF